MTQDDKTSFSVGFWPTVWVVVGLAMLVSLGTWQLSRYLQKKERETVQQQREKKPPVEIDSLEALLADDHAYRKAKIRGRLDGDTLFGVKHRHHNGDPGSWLLQPLELAAGDGTILVNRGWIPFQEAKTNLDAYVSDADGEFVGILHRLPKVVADQDMRESVKTGQTKAVGAVTEWDTIDATGMYDALDGPVPNEPLLLVLGDEHTGDPYPIASFEHVTEPYLTSGRHLSYSVFWYAVGLALLGLYLAAGFGALGSHRRGRPASPDQSS